MSKKPSRVIIDTDGGIDDALAIILALRSPEVEVAGITTVSGNVSVEQATTNSLRVVELLEKRNVWVARGSGNPLLRKPIRATDFHGKDGLGDSNLPQPRLRARPESALELLSTELHSEKRGGVTICCIGPLTNLAVLLTEHPDVARGIGEVMMMGGAFGITPYGYGNVTPVAEFNVCSDPEAAKIVFESGVRLRAVGLDITQMPESWLTPGDYSRLKMSKSMVSDFASRILAATMQKRRLFELHDPIAVGATIQPSLYEFKDYAVRVETKGEQTTGMTVTERREKGEKPWTETNVAICSNLKVQRFKRLFMGHLLKD